MLGNQIQRFLAQREAHVFMIADDCCLFVKEGLWGLLVWRDTPHGKSSIKQSIINKMNNWSWAKVVWPGEQWEATQRELEDLLR